MLTAEQKLAQIAEMCRHPGAHHWPDEKLAAAISRLINNEPLGYPDDVPIPYELAHDAVYEELDSS